MKIRVEIDEDISENEIVINCKEIDLSILEIQETISNILLKKEHLIFYKENVEYYFNLMDILFFETDENKIYSHTKNDVYEVRYKLYELEEILPLEFIRVSKSTILNVKHIRSINTNITSSSSINFFESHKQTYVSRHYYKDFKNRIMKVRRYYEK